MNSHVKITSLHAFLIGAPKISLLYYYLLQYIKAEKRKCPFLSLSLDVCEWKFLVVNPTWQNMNYTKKLAL